MRIVVVGTSGAGKTTLARRIAALLMLPHIELDAINWVVDGNYGPVRDRVWQRATHLVWLDYERPVIMARVISRTLFRAVMRTELWAGNRERWRQMLRPSHPIRWAWTTWRRRRAELEALLGQQAQAHLIVHRVRRPAGADGVVRELARQVASRAR
jgi:adenylate kinase family enzyme